MLYSESLEALSSSKKDKTSYAECFESKPKIVWKPGTKKNVTGSFVVPKILGFSPLLGLAPASSIIERHKKRKHHAL